MQNKVYLKILHNLSFSKSPKSLNLDKPNKSYKQYGGRDLAVKDRDLKEIARDLSVMCKDFSASFFTGKSTRLVAD